ncbi:MAG: hypothetical protein KDJ35_05665 [Alphaproteobacteria bacterium]|nr:hypothetical protein [Alphaproteobacteria bacterium]
MRAKQAILTALIPLSLTFGCVKGDQNGAQQDTTLDVSEVFEPTGAHTFKPSEKYLTWKKAQDTLVLKP